MKKLSKDERKGALALAIVVIAILGGSAIFRSYRVSSQDETVPVSVIYTEKSDSDSVDMSKSEKKKNKKQTKSGGKKSIKKQSVPDQLPRDFLSDTIPVM